MGYNIYEFLAKLHPLGYNLMIDYYVYTRWGIASPPNYPLFFAQVCTKQLWKVNCGFADSHSRLSHFPQPPASIPTA